jgi:NADH-quinone oxidoreductase subunit J
MWETLLFYCLASVIVLFAVMVVLMRNPVHCALCLGGTLISVAGLFLLLQAEFLTAVQVIVYVGGIMVLFLFVVMLYSLEKWGKAALLSRNWKTAAALGLVLMGELIVFSWKGLSVFQVEANPIPPTILGNAESLGWALYQQYLLPFEVASVLLLVAILGAVLYTRKSAVGKKEEQGKENGAAL